MPNWVITRIYITGPEDKIKEFEDKAIRLGGEEKVFSFDRINKRPEELDNTHYPPPGSKKIKVKTQTGEELEVEEIADCNNATPEMCKDLESRFGHNNWYDWNNWHWGTKWDCSESIYSQEDKMIEFQTAWACPQEILLRMSEMFPDLQFNGSYADEDFGSNAGYITNGGAYSLDDLSEEACETAATLWGHEGYYDDEKKEWVFEGDDD
jgi:hypothetical protein